MPTKNDIQLPAGKSPVTAYEAYWDVDRQTGGVVLFTEQTDPVDLETRNPDMLRIWIRILSSEQPFCYAAAGEPELISEWQACAWQYELSGRPDENS